MSDGMTKPFDQAEYRGRWSRLQAGMDAAGLDALLVSARSNYRYVTGHHTRQYANNQMRPMIAVLPASGEPVMLVYGLEIEDALRDTWVTDVRGYVDAPFPPESLVGLLRDLGLAEARIGCELGEDQRLGLPYLDFRLVVETLPRATFIDGGPVLIGCRMRKSEAELDRIERACRITMAAYDLLLGRVRPGMTLAACERLAYQALVEAGGDADQPGSATVDLRKLGPDYVFRRGDMFLADWGATYRGYRADVARCAVFGPPSPAQVSGHAELVDVFEQILGLIGPGVPVRTVAERYNREAHRLGMAPLIANKRIGHGIGLDFQEPPSLNAIALEVFEPGMVITPEPRFVGPGGKMIIEEDIAITATGIRRLSWGGDQLRVID